MPIYGSPAHINVTVKTLLKKHSKTACRADWNSLQGSLPNVWTSLCDALTSFNTSIWHCNNIYRSEKQSNCPSSKSTNSLICVIWKSVIITESMFAWMGWKRGSKDVFHSFQILITHEITLSSVSSHKAVDSDSFLVFDFCWLVFCLYGSHLLLLPTFIFLVCTNFTLYPPPLTLPFPDPCLTFCSLDSLLSSGGISTDLQDKRKKCQNKRKNQITDSSQLKDFPCKKFRQVSSATGTKQHEGPYGEGFLIRTPTPPVCKI